MHKNKYVMHASVIYFYTSYQYAVWLYMFVCAWSKNYFEE